MLEYGMAEIVVGWTWPAEGQRQEVTRETAGESNGRRDSIRSRDDVSAFYHGGSEDRQQIVGFNVPGMHVDWCDRSAATEPAVGNQDMESRVHECFCDARLDPESCAFHWAQQSTMYEDDGWTLSSRREPEPRRGG